MTLKINKNINFGLENRVCIITGGAQGIGHACAERLAREGAHIVLADVDDAKGRALAEQLQAT